MTVLTVQCPTCKRKVRWEADSLFKPFCSERCRSVDMGAWASESYKIGNATDADPNEIDQSSPDKEK
jgi:uncharacterized protein